MSDVQMIRVGGTRFYTAKSEENSKEWLRRRESLVGKGKAEVVYGAFQWCWGP